MLLAAGVFSFWAAYVRRWVGGRVSLDVQYDLRNRHLRTPPAPRLRRPRPAPDRPARVARVVGPRPHPGAARVPADHGRQPGDARPVVDRDAVPVAAAHAGDAARDPGCCCSCRSACAAPIFPATWDAQQRAGEVAGVVDEAVTGVRVVKGFGQEERELDHLADAAGGLYASRSRLVRLQAALHPRAPGDPRARPGRRARPRWLARHERRDHARHLPGLLHLPRAARRPGADVRRPVRRSASRPAPVASGSSTSSTPTRRVVEAPDAVDLPAVRGDVRFEDVTLRLHAQRAGARRLRPARARRARWSRSSARAAPASRRSRACSPASTTSPTAGSRSTASTCATSRSIRCAARSAWCSRTRSCSPTPSAPTSPTARPMPPTPRSGPPPTAAGATRSSTSSPTATTRSSASAASPSRAASGSASPWRGPSSATRACSCSTTPRRRSTRPPRRRSTPPCASSWPAARPSSSPTAGPRCASHSASR